MNKILILYPALFQVRSKFQRKLGRILSRQTECELVYPEDAHGFIAELQTPALLHKVLETNWQTYGISHAVIFDDGEEFSAETQWLQAQNIPIRHIHIKLTRVINIDKEDARAYGQAYQYIGRQSQRANGEPNWSNPYSMYDYQSDGDQEALSRDTVIHKFSYDFERDLLPTQLKKQDVLQLAGKGLGCHCTPLACHGDILADYVNAWDDGL